MKPLFATAGSKDPTIFEPRAKTKLNKCFAHGKAEGLLGYDIVRHVHGYIPCEDRVPVTVAGEDGGVHDLVLITFKCRDAWSDGGYSRNGYIVTPDEVDVYAPILNKKCWANPQDGEPGVPLL